MRETLRHAAKHRLKIQEASLKQCLLWLNGSANPCKSRYVTKTWWCRVRKAISVFSKFLSTTVQFEFNEKSGFNLRLTDALQKTSVIEPTELKQITFILHRAVHAYYHLKWASGSISNFICLTISEDRSLSKYIYSGQTGPIVWEFIHRARTNTLPIRARPMNKVDAERKCRRCHSEDETMAHLLQSCRANMTLINMRHSACLNIIYQAIKRSDLIIQIDEPLQYLQGIPSVALQRIDIYAEDTSARKILLVDLKCPIDQTGTFESADAKNLLHYANLLKHVKKIKNQYQVELHTILVGSLGTILDKSISILEKFGISKKTMKKLTADLSITAMRHSSRIWQFHSSGVFVDLADPSTK